MMPDYVRARAEAIAEWRPLWPGQALCEMIAPAGFAEGGLYADHNAGTRKVHNSDSDTTVGEDGEYDVEVAHEYYPVLARVLVTYRCREVRPGDVVRITAMNYEEVDLEDGRSFKVIAEKTMLAVIEGFDEAGVLHAAGTEAVPVREIIAA